MSKDFTDVDPEEWEEGESKAKGKIKRMKNLAQYKDLSDDEFERVMTQKALGIESSEELEKRINDKLAEFEKDYDLSDLKINDRDSLRALIQAHLTLEDYEQFLYRVRSVGINEKSLYSVEKLQKSMSDLRSDISKLQNDLNITRKVRKSDQDVSVIAYIDSIKDKAKRFYESKMSYIFCSKCNMLLATVWALYPENDRNKIALVCERVMEDGKQCGEKVVVSTKELLKNRGTSDKKITPESML